MNIKLFKSKRFILPLFIVIISLFMGIGYAKVNDIQLNLFGVAEANIPEELMIIDVNSNNDSNIIINSYDKTLLNSKIILDDSDINSTKSFEVTIYNSNKNTQFFKEVKYKLGNITYDNQDIDFILEGLSSGDEIVTKHAKTFRITFKYSDTYKEEVLLTKPVTLHNELNSIINFYFGYLINFQKGESDVEPSDYYLEANGNLHEIETEIPKRNGYIFMGWYDKEDYQEGQMFYNEEQLPTNVNDLVLDGYEKKLYAGWCPIEYTIIYHENKNNNENLYIPNDNITLPNAYQRVEYLESTNGQYIDTGVKNWNNTIEYETKISIIQQSSGTHTYFGAWDVWSTSGHNTPTVTTYFSYKVANSFIAGNPTTKDIGIKNGQTGIFSLRGNTLSWSEGQSMTIDRGIQFKNNQSIVLFADNLGGSVGEYSNTKMYYFKMWLDGNIIRNLIPCYRKSDGKTGMYDLTNDVFYTSPTGEFILGPKAEETKSTSKIKFDEKVVLLENDFVNEDKILKEWNTKRDGSGISYDNLQEVMNLSNTNNATVDLYAIWKYSEVLPDGYQRVEYLESTNGQYIDTGVNNWNNTIEYETKISIIQQSSGTHTYFGAWDVWSTSGHNTPTVTTYFSYKVANSFIAGNPTTKDIGIKNGQTGIFSLRGNTLSWSVGQSMTIDRGTQFINNQSIVLFADNLGGSVGEYSNTKMYYFKMWLDGNIIRNLIPCYRKNDNKLGMYDLATGKFYINLGSGEFISGPVITE